jgi:prepilin-type processing-associated H-X9-DG protein
VGIVGILLLVGGVSVCLVLAVVGILVALLVPAVGAARDAAARSMSQNNLKQIALAMHNYHDVNGALPAQSVVGENGQPMHSWRVALLPYMEQAGLYERYNFNEPWNSPNNRLVADQIVTLYQSPSSERTKGTNHTNYFVVSGDETMFGPNRWTKFSDVTDGLSNTIMVVECDSMSVPWAEPADIPFDQMEFKINPPSGIGVSSAHPGGANVAMGDGSVRFVSDQLDPQTFRYLLIRNDGNVIPEY